MTTTASSATNRHYRETCTRCIAKDKEISRLNAEVTRLTAAKSSSSSPSSPSSSVPFVKAQTEKLILGKLPQQIPARKQVGSSSSFSPRERHEPIKIVYGVCLAFAIAFVWATFAHGMATGNRLIQALSAISAPIIGIYLAIKFGSDDHKGGKP